MLEITSDFDGKTQKQGWGLFCINTGPDNYTIQFQRIDDEGECDMHFDSDNEAMKFVVGQAIRKDELALDALTFLAKKYPTEYALVLAVAFDLPRPDVE